MDVHIEPKPGKKFMGSAVAQTSQDMQTADGQNSRPAPSEATLQDDTEAKEDRYSPEAPLIQFKSKKKPRVVTDEADLDPGTRGGSILRVTPQFKSKKKPRVVTDEADLDPGTRGGSILRVTPQFKSKKKPRVMTDEADLDPGTRGGSILRVTSQEQRMYFPPYIKNHMQEEGGDDEIAVISQDNVLEEYIIDAIEGGDLSVVQQWLDEEGTKVNECKGGRASHGYFFVGDGTALHWAAYYGQLEIAKLLLDKGADPYGVARGGETVLHWACQSMVKNEKFIDHLLTASATRDQRPKANPLVLLPDNKGWTPLHYACYDNNMKLVQQLMGAGADPNTRNDKNCTPLHLLNEDSDGILELLDPDHMLPRRNDPVLQEYIIEKIKNGKVDWIQKWLSGKRGVVNCYRGGFTINDGLVLEGGTALHWAAYYGQRAIVEALIEKGAGNFALNSKKESVLHWACKGQEKNEGLVIFLLNYKVDVNFGDVEGYTALHYACLRGNHSIAEQLLLAGADKTAQALHGKTPVSIACRSGKTDLIDLLDKDHLLPRNDDKRLETSIVNAIRDGEETVVEQMTEVDVTRSRGGECSTNNFEVSNGTVLHWAAYYGKVEIVKECLERGASPKVMDKNSETILHWACKSETENDEMVKFLLGEYIAKRTYPLTDAEDTKCQVDSTNSEGYTALHYACWQGHQKIAKLLKDAKADPTARSVKGYTPLDFAVVGKKRTWKLARMLDDRHLLPRDKFPRLEKCMIEGGYTHNIKRWLKCQHRNMDHCRDWKEGGTALHWAAYHGQLDIVKMLIGNGANPRARAYDNGTVLHWACKSEEGNRELVRLLIKKGCKLDDRDKNGYTPFLLAASHGCQRVVEELLQWDRFRAVVNWRVIVPEVAFKAKESEGHTPLVRASLKGHHGVVNLLLKRGAKVEPQDLRTAIEEGNEHVVSDLLQSPQWPTLLRQCWEETTPFRELIKKMPDVAKQVLDRCIVSNPETRDPKNKNYEVVVDYSFVEDHNDECTRSSSDECSEPQKRGNSHEMIMFSNPIANDPKNIDLEAGLDAPLVEDHKDRHAKYSSKGDNDEPKYYPEKKEDAHKMRFDEVKNQNVHTTKFGPSFKKSNHPLKIMVQHGRLEMLTHPVISSLLQHKWFHFGLWLYLLRMLIYIIFLGSLTVFALAVLTPQSNTCLQVFSNPGISVCENETDRVNSVGEHTAGYGSEMMADNTTGERNVTCVICELSSTTLHFVFASAVIAILLVVIHLFMKGFQLCHESKSYICNWVNLLVNVFEVSLYVLSIMFVSVFGTPCMCLQEWQWQIGVIAILLAWVNLIRFFAKFPSTGIYVIMFGRILLTFLKVIILSVLLLTTFAITFHMTFSEAQFQRSPFYTPASSMLKILSMTAGDFNFDTIFRLSPSGESESENEILFPIISYLLWITFLIIIPILFINMLVGLAVGDTSEIKKRAHLTKLALQVDMILTAEHLLHVLHIHKYFGTVPSPVPPSKTEEFSFKNSAIKKVKDIICYLSGGEQVDAVKFQEALKYYQDSESEDQSEHMEALERMEERIQDLEQFIKKAILQKQGGGE